MDDWLKLLMSRAAHDALIDSLPPAMRSHFMLKHGIARTAAAWWSEYLDSTTPPRGLATPHVHVRPETAPAPRRTASDQAAGYGEHERDH